MSSANPNTPAPKRKAKVSRKHTVGRVLIASTLVLALVTALGSVWLVRHLDGNIHTQSLADLKDRPEKVFTGNGESLNILVLGSDTRAGIGNGIDKEAGGGGSDTTILVHLSADRSRAYAVSIPRDSIVDRPECGDNPAATEVMWNAAYTEGGATCTLNQLEQDAGIFVDHFAVLDFNGFGKMVDAVDGVPVCVPEDLVDKEHAIFVPAGDPSTLTGDQALDYVRARYVGEKIQQNDISRIKRQQSFIAALVRKVKSAGTLTRLDRVVGFLNAATQSLETDDEFGSVVKIGKVALQLQNIGLDKVKFVTLPTDYYPVDDPEFSGKVFWTKDADTIWQLIRDDKPLPAKFLKDSLSAEPPASSNEEPPSPSPSESGSPSETPSPTDTPTATPSDTPTPTDTPTPSNTPTPSPIPGVCQ